ncbi:hypothetical protein AYI68_g7879 [Smittium mucronatum]|uniref:Uncharacterized protein n=1 Tax=Smittium mucronatum TaxID=133383 RepID=A0A1R0GMF6_9FUNG|nr:hypothetical protein AYI68_g7879 [Smittium mucronatum]
MAEEDSFDLYGEDTFFTPENEKEPNSSSTNKKDKNHIDDDLFEGYMDSKKVSLLFLLEFFLSTFIVSFFFLQ